MEISEKHGRYYSNYITNQFKCQWSKYTNLKTPVVRVDQKQDPSICCLQETHFKYKDT